MTVERVERYRPPPQLGFVVEDRIVYLARLPSGPILVLGGGSAAIWVAATDTERTTSVARRVSELTGSAIEQIAPHVEVFIDELIRRNLLTRCEESE